MRNVETRLDDNLFMFFSYVIRFSTSNIHVVELFRLFFLLMSMISHYYIYLLLNIDYYEIHAIAENFYFCLNLSLWVPNFLSSSTLCLCILNCLYIDAWLYPVPVIILLGDGPDI